MPAKKDDNPVTLIQVTGGADIADANLHKIQLAGIVEHNCFQILCRQASISSFGFEQLAKKHFLDRTIGGSRDLEQTLFGRQWP